MLSHHKADFQIVFFFQLELHIHNLKIGFAVRQCNYLY